MKTTIEINNDIAVIDGKEYRLTEVKPKEPTWGGIFGKGRYMVDWKGEIASPSGALDRDQNNRFVTKRTAHKLATFAKICMLAEYLCPGFVPDWGNDNDKTNWGIVLNSGKLSSVYCITMSSGTELFSSRETAQRAIDIFRANGDEQELIDFLTK